MIQQVERFVILFIMECVEEIIVGGEFGPGTPVDTGFLRAMWWIDVNGAGSSPTFQRTDKQKQELVAAAERHHRGESSLEDDRLLAAGVSSGTSGPADKNAYPFDFGDVSTIILDVKPGDAVSLNNNTEYAEFVEKGTSKMAPRAMVASVLNASPAIADRVAGRMGFTTNSFVQVKK